MLCFNRQFVQPVFAIILMAAVIIQNPHALGAQPADQPPSIAKISQILRENPDNSAARWALAQASFRAQRYDVARYHVERLLRASQSPTNIDTLKEALAQITQVDPWGVELSFSLLPSTNIRRYTFNDEFETLFGTFIPVGGGEEESGIGVAVGAGLSYGIRAADNSVFTLRTRIDQNAYDSPDLNRTALLFALRHDSYAVGQSTTVEPFFRLRYDSEQALDRRDTGLNLSRRWWLDGTSQLDAHLTIENRTSFESDALSGPLGRLNLRYATVLNAGPSLGYGLSLARSKPEQSHLRYWEARVSTDVSRRFPHIGTFGVFGSVTGRQYDDVFPATTTFREDRTVMIGASYRPNRLEIFGSRPKLSCQVERNASSIALYDYETTDCRLAFERSF